MINHQNPTLHDRKTRIRVRRVLDQRKRHAALPSCGRTFFFRLVVEKDVTQPNMEILFNLEINLM